MKYSALLLAILALVAVSDALYLFEHNKLPCKFNIDISVKSLLKRYKLKLDVYDWYIRCRLENYNDVVVSDTIFRPDAEYKDVNKITNETTVYISRFSYNGKTCSHCDDPEKCNAIPLEEWKKSPLVNSKIGLELNELVEFEISDLLTAFNFTNYEEKATYDGETYKRYYLNLTRSLEGRNNKDIFSMFVDKNNRIVALVVDNDLPGLRTEYKFKYTLDVEPKDFMFKEKYIWNCTRPEVMNEPTKFLNSKCSSASVAHVAVIALIASLVCALLF